MSSLMVSCSRSNLRRSSCTFPCTSAALPLPAQTSRPRGNGKHKCFRFPHKYLTRRPHRDVVKLSRDAWDCNLCLPVLPEFFATTAMDRRSTRHSSRNLEKNKRLSETGCRKRQAGQNVSNEEGHEGSRHQPLTKSHELTTSTTRLQKSSSREPGERRMKKQPGNGRAQRQQRKL